MARKQEDARQTAKVNLADKDVQSIKRIFHHDGAPAKERQIFVFGSNLSGSHGGGAALNLYSAKWGQAKQAARIPESWSRKKRSFWAPPKSRLR